MGCLEKKFSAKNLKKMMPLPSSTFFPTTLDVFYGQPFKLQIAKKKFLPAGYGLANFSKLFLE